VALAWLIAREGVTRPIASATTVEQVDSLVRATQLELTREKYARWMMPRLLVDLDSMSMIDQADTNVFCRSLKISRNSGIFESRWATLWLDSSLR